MKKEAVQELVDLLTAQPPEAMHGIGIQILHADGSMVCVGNGRDSDLLAMAEIMSEQCKLKMLNLIQPKAVSPGAVERDLAEQRKGLSK